MISNRYDGHSYLVLTALMESHQQPRYYYKVCGEFGDMESNMIFDTEYAAEEAAEEAAENYIDQINGVMQYKVLCH